MAKPATGGAWWCCLGSLVLVALGLAAQSPPEPEKTWEQHMAAGNAARLEQRLADAEKHYRAAVEVAENSGPEDSRLAMSLIALGSLYRAQGRAAEAEPLLQRAQAIWGKALRGEHDHKSSAEVLDEAEMAIPTAAAAARLYELLVQSPALQQFAGEYEAAGPEKRAVFEKHLPALGAGKILDYLEATDPFCHHQSHELGQAILARAGDVVAALGECQSRCGTGCMHGVLKEAFGGAAPAAGLAELKKQMVGFCFASEMAERYQPGNCAHGIGHALLMLAGRDLGQALAACASFQNPALEYYCATGIFMEYEMEPEDGELSARSLHYPCDTHTRYPAACYRYHAFALLPALGDDRARFVAECQSLPAPRRLGCFHGLGATHMRAIARAPELLAEVCRDGTADEQTVCIEGAIEFLADYDQPGAVAACAFLEGENAAVCDRAAREKRYQLGKPTMKLYTGELTLPPPQP